MKIDQIQRAKKLSSHAALMTCMHRKGVCRMFGCPDRKLIQYPWGMHVSGHEDYDEEKIKQERARIVTVAAYGIPRKKDKIFRND